MSHPDVAVRNNQQLKHRPPRFDRWLLGRIFRAVGPAPMRLVMENGAEMSMPGVPPAATMIIRDRRTLLALIVDPEVAFGEAYADGRVRVEGDLPAVLTGIYQAWPNGRASEGSMQWILSKWMALLQNNTLRGSQNNIHRHYDLGNEFYRLWLDRQLVYTCAYFPSPEATLEMAQEAKLDYICRKLRLQAGETVVEAGCGWGALAVHMARDYGVSVRAFNISHEQILYARGLAERQGVAGRVEFIEDDYRNISGAADVFVSVGMLEHVGLRHFPEFSAAIHRTIGDRGRGFLHFIGRSSEGEFSRWIRKRIFPGAYAPTLGQAMTLLQPHHYAVLDVENLRPHYAKTVEHWLARFEDASDQVAQMFDPWFARAWRLYLAGSIAAFRAGSLQLFQICFAGSESPLLSWTRAHLYADPSEGLDTPWKHAMS
ncbi:MAG TPA: cyclopropane-fatty-acyl-phospholipid synthase family protein [Bryobacteraceae bacterium]|jgi:cyclopropane-fatty-acyl-phospholipid synthase|nr:cyclopropane-fatty-acyl-phospholipid synthase family protein [Bryobacteraceae bacterium]